MKYFLIVKTEMYDLESIQRRYVPESNTVDSIVSLKKFYKNMNKIVKRAGKFLRICNATVEVKACCEHEDGVIEDISKDWEHENVMHYNWSKM